jgi:hypothetical protein
LRALGGGPVGEACDIVGEFLALGDQFEHRRPTQVRADHDVGRGKFVAHQERSGRHGARDHVHGGVEIAIAECLAPRLPGARKGAVHDGAFEHARTEEQPFEIGATSRIADRNIEGGLGEGIGEIAADRRDLGNDRLAMPERRHLAHRIDREIGRLAIGASLHAEQMDVIRLADFLEHPQRDGGARRRDVIKCEVCHEMPPCCDQWTLARDSGGRVTKA